jgi:hypothetical protein
MRKKTKYISRKWFPCLRSSNPQRHFQRNRFIDSIFVLCDCVVGMKNSLLLISLVLFTFWGADASPGRPEKQAAIKISAKPIDRFDPGDPSRHRFGALEFRGGLVLTSRYKLFGGISALRMQPDGANFIALSDHGLWLRGRIVYAGNRPAAIEDAVMAPILDAKGKKADRWDTESIAEDGGFLYVGIEGRDSIMRFDYGKKGFLARAEPVPIPPDIENLPSNKGLEALVFVPRSHPLGGTLIAFSERGLNKSGNLKAFLIGGPAPGTFSVQRTQEYDISDASLLPDGDLLILERKFFLQEGVSIRLRRIRLNDIKPGSVVDGPIMLEAEGREEIDNMEALSVHRSASGAIILTMMSDDNYSIVQHTLLLQFELIDE